MSEPPKTVAAEASPSAVHGVAEVVAAQVRTILEEAQTAAEQVRAEVDRVTLARASETRRQAEDDAERIRSTAEAQAANYLVAARRSVDAFVAEREQRIREVTDLLLARSASIASTLSEADGMRQALAELLEALAVAAREAASEAAIAGPAVASLARPAHHQQGDDDRRSGGADDVPTSI